MNFEEFALSGCKGSIDDDYDIGDKLGEGEFGVVRAAKSRKTGEHVAIKTISKNSLKTRKNAAKNFIRETNIMKLCNHPHVVKYISCYQDDYHYYIVMECLNGGDLLEYINETGGLEEEKCKHVCAQIISGLEYMHGNLFAHRDLKLENILISNKKTMSIKLTDFGMANYIKVGSFHNTFCGSIHYSAPEIHANEKYNPIKSDLWSFGVIMYGLLVGQFPWSTDNMFDTIKDIKSYKFKDSSKLSDEARDLLGKIFTSPKKRYPISRIKNHPWLKRHKIPSYIPPRVPVDKIDNIVIAKIISLGFKKSKVLVDVYDNNSSMENAIYHMIVNRYQKTTVHNRVKFVRDFELDLSKVKQKYSPKISSDPGRGSKISPKSPKNGSRSDRSKRHSSVKKLKSNPRHVPLLNLDSNQLSRSDSPSTSRIRKNRRVGSPLAFLFNR